MGARTRCCRWRFPRCSVAGGSFPRSGVGAASSHNTDAQQKLAWLPPPLPAARNRVRNSQLSGRGPSPSTPAPEHLPSLRVAPAPMHRPPLRGRRQSTAVCTQCLLRVPSFSFHAVDQRFLRYPLILARSGRLSRWSAAHEPLRLPRIRAVIVMVLDGLSDAPRGPQAIRFATALQSGTTLWANCHLSGLSPRVMLVGCFIARGKIAGG